MLSFYFFTAFKHTRQRFDSDFTDSDVENALHNNMNNGGVELCVKNGVEKV